MESRGDVADVHLAPEFITSPRLTLLCVYYESINRDLNKRLDIVEIVYYESRKRKVKTRLVCEYRCDERLRN